MVRDGLSLGLGLGSKSGLRLKLELPVSGRECFSVKETLQMNIINFVPELNVIGRRFQLSYYYYYYYYY